MLDLPVPGRGRSCGFHDVGAQSRFNAEMPRLEADAPWLEANAPWLEANAPWLEADAPWLEADAPWLEAEAPRFNADAPRPLIWIAKLVDQSARRRTNLTEVDREMGRTCR